MVTVGLKEWLKGELTLQLKTLTLVWSLITELHSSAGSRVCLTSAADWMFHLTGDWTSDANILTHTNRTYAGVWEDDRNIAH